MDRWFLSYRSPTDFTPITAGRNDGTNEDERRTSCTENQGLEWDTRCSNQKLTTETSCTVPGTFGHCELTNDIDGNVNSHFDVDYAGYADKATCELGKPSHYWSYCENSLFGSEYGCVTPGEWGHCLFNDGDNNTALPADSIFYENDNQYCKDITTTDSNLYSDIGGGGTGDKILAIGGTFSKPAYHWSQCQISYNSGTTWDWTNEFATQDECTKPGDWGNCIVRGSVDAYITYDDKTYELCSGDINVLFNGNHNIQEVSETGYTTYSSDEHINAAINGFETPGTVKSVSGLAAGDGETRYFVCTAHPSAKFKTTCGGGDSPYNIEIKNQDWVPADSELYETDSKCEDSYGISDGSKDVAFTWGTCTKDGTNDAMYITSDDCTQLGKWGTCQVYRGCSDNSDSDCSTAVDDSAVFYDTGDIPLDSPIYDDQATCESLDGTGENGEKTNAYGWGSCLKDGVNTGYYYDENDCTKQGTYGHCKVTKVGSNHDTHR